MLIKSKRYCVVIISLVFCSILAGGCAGVSSPVSNGILFTNVKGPVAVTGEGGYSKEGTSSCVNVLGLIASGDASISTAMKAGNITKIHHVDHKSFSILGLYVKWTTYVYGE